VIEVRLKSMAEFGAFVEIERGVEGLVHILEYPDEWQGDATGRIKTGEIVKAEIISLDPEERRIALSFKRAFEREETAEALKFMERAREVTPGRTVGPSGGSGATLGDVLKEKLGDKLSPPKLDDMPKE
jgi:small subunit ribosomal protein S1